MAQPDEVDPKKTPVEGVTIIYQGKECGPVFSWEWSVGLEPGRGEVSMLKQDIEDIRKAGVIQESIPGVDSLPEIHPKTQERKRGFLSAGQLVFQEFIKGEVPQELHKVVWDQILLTERAIEVAYAEDEDSNETCRVELTDIRYLYGKRGVLCAIINLPRQGVAPPTADTTDQASSATGPDQVERELDELKKKLGAVEPDQSQLDRELETLKKILNGEEFQTSPDLDKELAAIKKALGAEDSALSLGGFDSSPTPIALPTGEGPPLIPGSTNAGHPWTVETVCTKKIFPALPGTPRLRIQQPRPAFYDKIVGPKIWDWILPKDAMQQILDEFQIVFALNFDGSVTLWEKNKGGLRLESGDTITALRTSDPNVDDRVSSSREHVAYRYVPVVAVVVGAPRILSTRLRLEAVGWSRQKGDWVQLQAALKELGLTMETAARFAVLTDEERSALLGITEEGLHEFNRWAFKAFMLPGGASRHADKLPILKATAVVDKVGQKLPLRVFSESFTVNSVLDLRNRNAIGSASRQLAEKQQHLLEVQSKLSKSVGLSVGEVDSLLAAQNRLEGEIKGLENKLLGGAAAALAKGPPSPAAIGGRVIADQILAALKRERSTHYRVAVNVPFGEQAKGWHVEDENRGLVLFDTIQGNVFKEGIPLEGTYLIHAGQPKVELEFAYVKKPKPEEDLRFDHRYFLALERTKEGFLSPRKEIPLGCAPLVIYRPELQEIVQVDGSSNRGLLDSISKKLLQQQLLVPQSTTGAVVDFNRPVAAVLTGSTLSVSFHHGTDEIPRVVAHIGNYARGAKPDSPFRTRGLGGGGGLDDFDGGPMGGSVFTPRGGR